MNLYFVYIKYIFIITTVINMYLLIIKITNAHRIAFSCDTMRSMRKCEYNFFFIFIVCDKILYNFLLIGKYFQLGTISQSSSQIFGHGRWSIQCREGIFLLPHRLATLQQTSWTYPESRENPRNRSVRESNRHVSTQVSV